MKRLFYISGTVFFLALTLMVGVHIGQKTAGAAPAQKIVGFTFTTDGANKFGYSVILANGDVHWLQTGDAGEFASAPVFRGNYWQ